MKNLIMIIIYLLITYAGFAFTNWDWLWVAHIPDWNMYERLMFLFWTIVVFPLFYLLYCEFLK